MKKSLLLSAALLTAASGFAFAPKSPANAVDFQKSLAAPSSLSGQAAKKATRASESINFTYAEGYYTSLKFQGMTGGETMSLMFELDGDLIKAFAGNQVTAFSVVSACDYYGKYNDITDGKFFMSTTFEGADYSQDFNFSENPVTLSTIPLDQPYTIKGTEQGILFGYSFTIPENDDMYYLPVDYAATSNAGVGLYGLSEGGAFPDEIYSFASQAGALLMYITIEGDKLPKGMTIASVANPAVLKLGADSAIPVSVNYFSGSPIESLEVAYNFGGKDYTYEYVLPEAAPAKIGGEISFNLVVPAQSELLKEDVAFSVAKFNGEVNPDAAESCSATVAVVNEVPVRQTLIEEYTGTWCGYCPRGFAALEYIKENYPEFVTAAFHYGTGTTKDPMNVLNFQPTDVSGFPSAALNRNTVVDPYYGTQTHMDFTLPIVGDILALNAIPTPWDIKLAYEWVGEGELVAKADVKNVIGYDKGNYKLVYMLVADGLSGKTKTWYQSNYYASNNSSPANIPQLNDFCKGGQYGQSTVRGLIYNDVLISAEGVKGVAGSIPSALAAEEVVSHSFSFDISAVPTSLLPDMDKVRVIVAVTDAKGNVLNCAKIETPFTGNAVEGIEAADAPVEYFNLQGQKVANPTEGIFIRRQGNSAVKVMK